MEESWYFKSLDEVFGPLPLADLVAAARAGTLARGDLVRQGEQGPWRTADTIDALFRVRSRPIRHEPEWLVEVLGQVLGPLSLSELARMIRERKLLASDRIRHVESQEWQPASLILQHQGRSSGKPASDTGRAGDERPNETSAVTAPHGSPDAPEGHALPRGIDDLESLILGILAVPPGEHAKPTLAELGLGDQAAAAASKADERAIADSPASTSATPAHSSGISSWVRLFRGDASLDTALAPMAATGQTSALVATDRSRTNDDSQRPDERKAQAPRRRPGWLEWVLAGCLLFLNIQMLPESMSFRWLPNILDVRQWSPLRWSAVCFAATLFLLWLRLRPAAHQDVPETPTALSAPR